MNAIGTGLIKHPKYDKTKTFQILNIVYTNTFCDKKDIA
jgi:hypothetical protein